MSFQATLDFIVRIHNLVNIDLPSQGVFRIRTSIYQSNKNSKSYAFPFQLAQQPANSLKYNKKIMFPAKMTVNYFHSKAGLIKYADQKVNLNDVVRFKLEIQSFPTLQSENIYMDVELQFSKETDNYPKGQEFVGKIIATKTFKLQLLQLGIFNYFQCQYMDDYNCKCGITLFACLSNFKFGKYKLPHTDYIIKQGKEGDIVSETMNKDGTKNSETSKEKETHRLKVNTFEEMLEWIKKYHAKRIQGDPLIYFYHNYVKNLRYYFYLIQQKCSKFLKIPRKLIIKVSKEFFELPDGAECQSENSSLSMESLFQKYMTNYEPSSESISVQGLLGEIHEIYSDIYEFLMDMEKEFAFSQINEMAMIKEYETYVRQLYGERVFKSVVYGNKEGNQSPHSRKVSAEENKKIAKTMREKGLNGLASYPIINNDYFINKDNMQYLFYEVTYPQGSPYSKSLPKTDLSTQSQNPPKQYESFITVPQQDSLSQQKRKNSFEAEQYTKNQEAEQKDNFGSEISDIEVKKKENMSDLSNEQNCKSDKGERDILEELEHHSLENVYKSSELQRKKSQQEKNIQEQKFLKNYNEQNMLIIMCHGFQGSSYDMMMIFRGLKQRFPKAYYLPSRSNEGETTNNIEEMGKKLAIEITNFIKNYMDDEKAIISMVGHSMGGIIARSSLKYLPRKFSQFGFYCSLSSPHLGYLNGVDQKIQAGLWFIDKIKPVVSLRQLSMKDNSNPRQTFLYRLSQEGSLKNFRKIILWSSFEDSYVAWHSARIMVHNHKKKTDGIRIEEEMIGNILGNHGIHRIDINFNVKKNNIDAIIGRTAHINLIIQQSLFKIVNSTIPELFDIRKP